ncbi:MAG: MFS transporter, partial [Alphaproteobacteria bacterium]|nr:MFS transporter [Alphaproteobacteria bacterium]
MNKHKLILTSSVANSFEWYDYALFGHFAPIIGQKFFPNTDPSISLLYAFLAGILFGSLVSYLIKSIFTPEQFNSWAWRLPFLIGIFIFFAGIYIKKHTAETPLFLENKSYGRVEQHPLKFAFKHHWFDMLISILINGTGSVIFYVESIYLISYLKIHRGFGEDEVSTLVNICYIIMIIVTILGGWLSDKIGRRKIFV